MFVVDLRGVGWVLAIWCQKILLWQLSGFDAFLYNLLPSGIKLFKASVVCIQMDGTPILWEELLMLVVGSLSLRVYLLLLLFSP